MTQEDLKDVWYFWNHSFYNTKKGRTANVEVKCFDCGKITMSNNCVKRNIVLDGSTCSSKTRNSSFICKSCYKIRRENLKKEKEKKHA